jgi:hypothetical protein
MKDPTEGALELLALGSDLTSTLLEDLRAGRLDRIDATLDARETCLRTLQTTLRTLGTELPDSVQKGLVTLRAHDAAVIDALQAEKQEVLRGLAAVRGQRIDPYVDAIEGPVALDQRS